MELDKLSKARDLYYEYENMKQLKEDISAAIAHSCGRVHISTPPVNKEIRSFGYSERNAKFLDDLQEAVRRHLERISDEIYAL